MIDTNNSKIGNPFPFRVFCQKVIPLAFDESMSYLELLYSLLHYLKETVIPAVNNNADAVTELQNLYNELKSYVDNYFDNLDVQEEINNKLDEMAESGQLADIIAQYLQLSGLLCYNTVNDMKNADNLDNGSFAKTYGFYNINDNGGAFYKIRNIQNTDIINNKNIIALNNPNLIAELVINSNSINVAQLGAKFDGTTDDTECWNLAINYAQNLKLKEIVGKKEFSLISETLKIPANININTMYLCCDNNFSSDYMIYFNTNDGTTQIMDFNNQTYSNFENISLQNNDSNNIINGILIGGNLSIKNMATRKLNQSIKQMPFYIDVIRIINIAVAEKISTDYAIELNLLGDANYIDTAHIYDTIGTNNFITVSRGHLPLLLKNIINGHIYLKGGICEINGMHGEINSSINCELGNYKLSNIYLWKDETIPAIIINDSKAIIDNSLIRYEYTKTFSNDTDINLIGAMSLVNINNCYKDILQKNDINKHFRTELKVEIENVTFPKNIFNSVNGNISNNDRFNNSEMKSFALPDTPAYYINNPVIVTEEGNWKIESGTYYYLAHVLADKIRMIGIGNNHTQNVSLTQGGGLLKFQIVSQYTPLRIYRGTSNNNYNNYIDLVNYNLSVCDNGNIIGGNIWKERTAGAIDSYLTATNIIWNGKNVIVFAESLPSTGTWKKGDIIINSNGTRHICTASGTPGTWN